MLSKFHFIITATNKKQNYNFIKLSLVMILLSLLAPKCYAENQLLASIDYLELETAIPPTANETLLQISKQMLNNQDIHLLIESSAFKENTPIQTLNITALKRALVYRKFFFIKDININRINIHILNLETTQRNIIKIYKVEK